MQIKKIILTVLSIVLVSTVFAQKSEIRQLRSFNEISSYDGVSVQLVSSDKNYVKVSGKYIDKVVTQVSGKTLKIKMNFGSSFKGEDNHIIVYYSNELIEIKATEGSSISSNDVINSDNLIIRAIEGAEVELRINTNDVDAKISTGGEIDVSGKTKNVVVGISTGGNFDGKNLKAKFGEVKITTGGEAKMRVSNVLDASVTMGGNIYYYGNPKTVNENISLGGRIESK